MKTRTRQSDGGLAVLTVPDEDKEVYKDGSKKPIQEWEDYGFVCSYRYRPDSLRGFQEDALKMCIYFGCKMYPERNVGDIDIFFKETGYGGYLLYDINPTTGMLDINPGFASYERKKGELFMVTKDYIKFRGHKERHESYLQEVKNIKGIEQMNKYDRFTAHGGCLLGMKQIDYHRRRFNASFTSEEDVKDIMDAFLNM